MTTRGARRLVVATFVVYAVALTWPGVLPFNRIRPFILGLPFSFFWVVLWVILGGAALWIAESVYSKAEGATVRGAAAEAPQPITAEEAPGGIGHTQGGEAQP
jgi:hypothetical protein